VNDIEIIKVEAGARHSVCLSNDGKIYVFGLNVATDATELQNYVP